jgi:hypothetical protein
MDTPEHTFIMGLGLIVGAVRLSVWQRLDLAMPIFDRSRPIDFANDCFCYLLSFHFTFTMGSRDRRPSFNCYFISALLSKKSN